MCVCVCVLSGRATCWFSAGRRCWGPFNQHVKRRGQSTTGEIQSANGTTIGCVQRERGRRAADGGQRLQRYWRADRRVVAEPRRQLILLSARLGHAWRRLHWLRLMRERSASTNKRKRSNLPTPITTHAMMQMTINAMPPMKKPATSNRNENRKTLIQSAEQDTPNTKNKKQKNTHVPSALGSSPRNPA